MSAVLYLFSMDVCVGDSLFNADDSQRSGEICRPYQLLVHHIGVNFLPLKSFELNLMANRPRYWYDVIFF